MNILQGIFSISSPVEMNNYLHWHWMLDKQFRSLNVVYEDIAICLNLIKELSVYIELEKNRHHRMTLIQNMVKEIRNLLDELYPFQKMEKDLLFLASPYATFQVSLCELLEQELYYIMETLKLFYTRTQRMTVRITKKEARELTRCLALTIHPLQRHLDQIERELFPSVLEWLQ
ncbi:hypothetical protein PAECIP111891_02096 [Paenibacillus allorhizoplanae]|uniref:DUF2935 domain-containing protein n=1 Tax=Paenibacillus allorhizoplanae TaxID=2905648 RepID=A0ABM9C4Q0_9BACL|nr:hypothetical protein [Paenibacillus allorhizoplanae]CAH1202264.1 hypothetical protein PAECIP111891_02096 [Paenibacillus allorhizoplanae]